MNISKMLMSSLVFCESAAVILQQTTLKCLNACPTANVNCQAKCVGTPFPDANLVSKTNQCYQACGSNNDCITQCATIFVKGDGVGTSKNDTSSNGTNNGTGASKLKYSSAMITSASTLVLATFTFN